MKQHPGKGQLERSPPRGLGSTERQCQNPVHPNTHFSKTHPTRQTKPQPSDQVLPTTYHVNSTMRTTTKKKSKLKGPKIVAPINETPRERMSEPGPGQYDLQRFGD
eukprot:PhF_6_TR42645/c0_g1_i2/m.64178